MPVEATAVVEAETIVEVNAGVEDAIKKAKEG